MDEIRGLSAKLSMFKELYYAQRQEREMAGEQYIALQDDFDKNKQVFHTIRYGRFTCAQKLTRWPA